jgi:hypothetical protein
MNCTQIAKLKGVRWLVLACCIGATGLMLSVVIGKSSVYAAGCDHVRWDLIHVNFSTMPITLSPGGTGFASADMNNQITFTDSSGTFVAPESGGISGDVTGGGKWETFDGMTTKSGTYRVTKLVSWQFANFQPAGAIDLIDDTHPRANGNAILRIQYDDGSEGVLGIGCHGMGAPPGIQEGVIATKGYVTYWTGAFHPTVVSLLDINFTSFHILK